MENKTTVLDDIEKLSQENKELQQKLLEANKIIELIDKGRIDALLVENKVYSETTADKTYRILIERMNEGAVTLNKDETILYCNLSFANMTGQPLQKVIGLNFGNFIEGTSKEHFKTLINQGWENPITGEGYMLTNDGKAVPVIISINTLQLDNTLILSIILTDLSLRYKIQEELKLKTRQLEQKNLELESANKVLALQNEEKEKRAAELSVANQDLTAFTFVSSHDLQEPLRKIKNFVTVLDKEEKKNLSDDGKIYLQRMYETANGMQVLLEDLLAYGRIKIAEKKFEKFDITLIVEEVKKDFEEDIKKKNATIEASHLCETNIIRLQFRLLIQNLISNSLKFSKAHTAPHIKIKSEIVKGDKVNNDKLSSKADYCHITYTDNGIGFDPQYNERIFGVLQHLNSKDEYEGNGIGLAICKRIMENHNGLITATGEVNKGAQFDIYIPVL